MNLHPRNRTDRLSGSVSVGYLILIPVLFVTSPLAVTNPIAVNNSPADGANSLVLNINVVQIQRGYIWADLALTRVSLNSSDTVRILSSQSVSSTSTIGSGLLTALSDMNFSLWNQENGSFVSERLQQVLLENTSSSFPDDSSQFTLWIGTNISDTSEYVHTSVPTYSVETTFRQETISQINKNYSAIPTIQSLFDSYKYVFVSEITLDHSYDLQAFAKLVYLVPWFLMGLSIIITGIAVLRPKFADFKLSDYLQISVTLLLFIPVLIFSISQLIPPGDSVFLQEWLAGFSFETVLTFFGIIVSIIIIIASSSWRKH